MSDKEFQNRLNDLKTGKWNNSGEGHVVTRDTQANSTQTSGIYGVKKCDFGLKVVNEGTSVHGEKI